MLRAIKDDNAAATATLITAGDRANVAKQRLLVRMLACAAREEVGSVADFEFLNRGTDTDTAAINRVLYDAAQTGFDGVLGYTEELLASCDFNHDPRSSIVALDQTDVQQGNLARVLAWYDNEWGFSCRMADVAGAMGRLL